MRTLPARITALRAARRAAERRHVLCLLMAEPKVIRVNEALVTRIMGFEPDSNQHISRTILQPLRESGAMPPVGDWWATPAARGALAVLNAACGASGVPAPLHGLAHDLLRFRPLFPVGGAREVRMRCAYREGAPPVAAEAAWHAVDEWVETDTTCDAACLVLHHSFTLGNNRIVMLRSVVTGLYTAHCSEEAFIEAAFSDNVPIVFRRQASSGAPISSAVAVNGAWLCAADVAALPAAMRGAIKAARSAQLLHALRSCLQHRWAGGFAMLREHAAATVLDIDAQIAVGKLAAELLLARAGGRPSVHVCLVRRLIGELLQAQKRHAEAVVYYRAIVDDITALPDELMAEEPANEWANLAIALSAAGDMDAAIAASESGLKAREPSARFKAAHPDWQENARLRLLELIILFAAWKTKNTNVMQQPEAVSAMARIFQPYAHRALKPSRGTTTQLEMHIEAPTRYWVKLVASPTGQRLVLRKVNDPGLTDINARWWVEAVPDGAEVPPSSGGDVEHDAQRQKQLLEEGVCASIVAAQRKAQQLAPLPPARCAQCGAKPADKPFQRCAICRGPAYCGRECQRLHWKAVHKAECSAPADKA